MAVVVAQAMGISRAYTAHRDSLYVETNLPPPMYAVAEATIRYHAPARYDDVVRVETRLTDVRSRAVTFEYLIRNARSGERLASARTLLVSLDPTGKPVPMPADVRALMERGVVPE